MSGRGPDHGAGPEGFVVIDKPAGMTSHDVVAAVRRRLGLRRVGHGGTLDPDATGVLLVALGGATRLLRFVTALSKSYTGEVVFGVTTTTLDASGEVVATFAMDLDEAAVSEAAAGFVGRIEQVPPMVSALKMNGRRLYELAREGKEVERAPRPIEVYELSLQKSADPSIYRLFVSCSSGTYVRSLAGDLGERLGGGAHLRNLRRVGIGPFLDTDAIALEALGENDVRPPAELVAHLSPVVLDGIDAARVANGGLLRAELVAEEDEGPFALRSTAGTLLAVYERFDAGRLKPIVVLSGSRAAEAGR